MNKASGDLPQFEWENNQLATDDFVPYCHLINATLFEFPVAPSIEIFSPSNISGNATFWRLPLDSTSIAHEGDLNYNELRLNQR